MSIKSYHVKWNIKWLSLLKYCSLKKNNTYPFISAPVKYQRVSMFPPGHHDSPPAGTAADSASSSCPAISRWRVAASPWPTSAAAAARKAVPIRWLIQTWHRRTTRSPETAPTEKRREKWEWCYSPEEDWLMLAFQGRKCDGWLDIFQTCQARITRVP